MSNNKFESLLELLINEENDKAEALFHEIVVEKSRDIYENLADEEVTAEAKESETTEEESIEEVGGDATDELVKDISSEEEGEMDADKGEEMPADMDADKGEDDMEDRVVDLEDALDELKAEFEAMMDKKDGDEEKDETVAPEVAPELTPEMESKEAPAKETVKEYKNMAKADTADHADNKKSPVKDAGSKLPKGGDNIAKGSAEEKGRPAPSSAKMTDATTEPKMKEVKADHKDGTDASAKKSPVASK